METFTPSANPSPQPHSQSWDLQRAAQLFPLNLPGDSHSPLGMKSLPLRQGKEYICSLGDTKAMVNLAREGRTQLMVCTHSRKKAAPGWRRRERWVRTPFRRMGPGEVPIFWRPSEGL